MNYPQNINKHINCIPPSHIKQDSATNNNEKLVLDKERQ